jgi:hypothetical protein
MSFCGWYADVKYWGIIADNLSKAGWSSGCVSAIDSHGRTIWIADAHRDDGKRFVVQADELLTVSGSRIGYSGWDVGLCLAVWKVAEWALPVITTPTRVIPDTRQSCAPGGHWSMPVGCPGRLGSATCNGALFGSRVSVAAVLVL